MKGSPKKLTWNPQAEEVFEALKRAFTSTPVLKHPDPSKPFSVEVDASETRVGAGLSQRSGIFQYLPALILAHSLTGIFLSSRFDPSVLLEVHFIQVLIIQTFGRYI